jgi:recombinational DNA repair ATPase RecF
VEDEISAIDLLVDQLGEATLPDDVSELVLAAAIGDEALSAGLGGRAVVRPTRTPTASLEVPSLFLESITVEGFRGIADRARLGLRPGPGLTLVVGRNGSGKSSFAEAAELALTGLSSRWERRSKVWEEGWACLHHDGPRAIELRILTDGQAGSTVILRRWAAADGLADGTTTVQRPGGPEQPVATLGLANALATWRPFLSYNELGGLLDEGPARLHDAVSAVLGLEEWVEVEERLTAARRDLETSVKTANSEADRLRSLVVALDDDRAASARDALPKRGVWDLEIIEALATGSAPPPEGLAALEVIATLPLVDLDLVGSRAETLRTANAAAKELQGSDASRALNLADLLERALGAHREGPPEDCPVCGTAAVLDAEWHERSAAEVERLRREASDASAAQKALARALSEARALLTSPPTALSDSSSGIDTTLTAETWQAWVSGPDDPDDLAHHLETFGPELAAAVAATRQAAVDELRRRQDVWQPVAAQLAAWLPGARLAQSSKGRIDDLKAAASWVAAEATAVRNERFAPIAERVQEIWATLRHTSNVALEAVTLEGTKTRRRVELTVTVDEVAGAALSVMSQGELHSLALSLFLPRATLPASPFRFLVIDDPVQAMDTARVDGLARTFAAVAVTHQVIVFTHDERLPDACRRLDLPATVLEVTRAEHSQVMVRARHHPVDNYCDDARAILATEDYPMEARRRVIPGLCRNALEAGCVDATRRRLLTAGVPFAQIDEVMDRAGKLLPRLALALFGDAGRAGDVMSEINRRWGREAGDCVQALRRGAHELVEDNPVSLIAGTDKLAHAVAALP